MSDFDSWGLLEMLGHRQYLGRIRAVEVAGATFLEVSVPAPDDPTRLDRRILAATGSVYAITPAPEEKVRAEIERRRRAEAGTFALSPAPDDDEEEDDEVDEDGADLSSRSPMDELEP